MKISSRIAIVVFASLSFQICCQNIWEIKDSVNGPSRGSSSSFVISGEGYIVGGLDDFGFKRKMYSYDPSQNDWDDELALGGLNGDGLDRGSACGFSIGDKGYICLGQGQTNPYFKDTWEYDPINDTWTQKADFTGTARRQAVAFVIGNEAFVGTGQDASGLCKDFYKYDPVTNSWTQINDFPGTARRQAVAFTMGDQAYFGTGDDGVLKNDFWMYEASIDTWIQKTSFPGTPRAGAVGWGIFPTAFIATGEDNNFNYTKDVWEYNYFSNTWTQRSDFIGSGRKNAVAMVINNIGYIGTGYSGIYEDDFYSYTGILSVNEFVETKINLFPNPFLEYANVTFQKEIPSIVNIKAYDQFGRDVTESFIFNFEGNQLKIRPDEQSKGNYFLKINEEPFSKNGLIKFTII